MKEKNRLYNKNWSFNNLLDIKGIFERLGIRYWIDCGLVLGLHREGDMIAGDEDDVDICFWKDDAPKLKKALIEFANEDLRARRTNRSKDGEISAISLRRVSRVDIHAADRKGDIVYFPMYKIREVNPHRYGVYVYPAKCFEKLGTIKWRGVDFPCPNFIEDYLVARYGSDWHINKIETGEWTDCRDVNVNPCLQLDWTAEDLGRLR